MTTETTTRPLEILENEGRVLQHLVSFYPDAPGFELRYEVYHHHEWMGTWLMLSAFDRSLELPGWRGRKETPEQRDDRQLRYRGPVVKLDGYGETEDGFSLRHELGPCADCTAKWQEAQDA